MYGFSVATMTSITAPTMSQDPASKEPVVASLTKK